MTFAEVVRDIPPGWATLIVGVLVALIGLAGTLLVSRFGRLARLERENRQLWFVCKRLLHTLYVAGITPDDEVVEIINGKE